MTDLPFRAFRVVPTREAAICFIDTDLGNDMFLFSAGMHEQRSDGRIGYVLYSWWIGKFVYEEGIGGRQILDTKNVDIMLSFASKFRGGPLRPSTQEIIAALDRAQTGKEVFNRWMIEGDPQIKAIDP